MLKIFDFHTHMGVRTLTLFKGKESFLSTKEGFNVIFIVVDALRPSNLSCFGYNKPTSPNIDNLAKDGVLFEDAYACTNVTDPSLTTIFSGLYPLSHGIIRHGEYVREEDILRMENRNVHFLPEILKSEGYVTAAIDWLGRWHKRGYDYYINNIIKTIPGKVTEASTDFFLGFKDKFLTRLSLQHARKIENAKKSTTIDEGSFVTDRAKRFIARYCDEKFFLFLHYWDTHHPYAPPIDYYKAVDQSGKIKGNLKRTMSSVSKQLRIQESLIRYDASIAYVDHEIGNLLETFENYGLSEKTIILLTSDHGESLTEHRIYFDHHTLYDPSIHVPLIIQSPNLPANKRIKGFVQHFDIVPTIPDILGFKWKNFNFDGVSALPLIDGNKIHSAIYAEEAHTERKRAIRTTEYKYIYSLSKEESVCRYCGYVHGGMEELYDLENDPGENENIIKKKTSSANVFRKRLASKNFWKEGEPI